MYITCVCPRKHELFDNWRHSTLFKIVRNLCPSWPISVVNFPIVFYILRPSWKYFQRCSCVIFYCSYRFTVECCRCGDLERPAAWSLFEITSTSSSRVEIRRCSQKYTSPCSSCSNNFVYYVIFEARVLRRAIFVTRCIIYVLSRCVASVKSAFFISAPLSCCYTLFLELFVMKHLHSVSTLSFVY